MAGPTPSLGLKDSRAADSPRNAARPSNSSHRLAFCSMPVLGRRSQAPESCSARSALARRQYQRTDIVGQLIVLPCTLSVRRSAGGPDGLECVRSSLQTVVGHVGRSHGVPGRTSRSRRRCAIDFARSCVRCQRRLPCFSHGDLASGPSPRGIDGGSRTIIRAALGKQRQRVFSAVSGPACKELMTRHGERTTAVNRNETLIPHEFSPPGPTRSMQME